MYREDLPRPADGEPRVLFYGGDIIGCKGYFGNPYFCLHILSEIFRQKVNAAAVYSRRGRTEID